jgi:prevent-host-death family protein
MAIYYGYTGLMDVSIADAKNRLTQLVRAVEEGEPVVITRNGKPVAQLVPPPPARRKVRFGGMQDRIRLLPGWTLPWISTASSKARFERLPVGHQHPAPPRIW